MKKRTILLAALVALACGTLGWRLAAPALAQSGGGKDAPAGAATEQQDRTGRVMITIGTPGDDELAGPDVLGGPILPDILELAAKALGIPRAQLVAEQAAGKSLDELARAHGTTKQAVVDAIMAGMRDQFRQHVEQAVASGKLGRAQADKLLSTFNLHIELDDLPRDDGRLEGAPPARRGLFGFFKGDGQGDGEVFTLPVPPLGLGEEDVLIPALPGVTGRTPRVITIERPEALEQATLDKVRAVLKAAVADGRLGQPEMDEVLQRLDPAAGPVLKVLRWQDDFGDEDETDNQNGASGKAQRDGTTAPTRRRLVESL